MVCVRRESQVLWRTDLTWLGVEELGRATAALHPGEKYIYMLAVENRFSC